MATTPFDKPNASATRSSDRPHSSFNHYGITFEEMFRGNLSGAAVYVGEVAKRALRLNAAAVVVVHNHPSGIPEPSHADRELTERLRQALALLEVRLLDHVITCDTGDTCSFAERGWL